MTEAQIFETYQRLSKVVVQLLHHHPELWESFITNLNSVLQSALDFSVTPDDLTALHNIQVEKLNQHQLSQYLARVLERPRAYLVICYFYAEFILLYSQGFKEEKDCLRILAEQRITEEDLHKIITEYQLLSRTISQ